MMEGKDRKIVRFPNTKGKKIGRVLTIGFIIILGIFIGLNIFKNTEKIYTAEYGYLKPSVEGCGILIRREQVVKAPITGNVNFLVPENERVREGDVIAEIKDSSIDIENIEKRLEEIDREIKRLEGIYQSKQPTNEEFKTIETEAKLEQKKEQIVDAITNGNLSMPISFKKEILTYLDKKENIRKDFYEPLIDLNKEKQALIEKTNEAGVKLKAPFSGVVSYKIDNFEDIFNIANIEELAQVDIKNSNYGIINYKIFHKEVDEPVFKIVDNFKWYMIVEIDAPLNFFNSSKTEPIWIRFPSNEIVKCEVFEVLDNGRLIISGNEYFKDLISERKIHIKIEKNNEFGIIIPTAAIISDNNKCGVMIKGPRGKEFREIEVLYENGNKAIVTGVKRWERIIN